MTDKTEHKPGCEALGGYGHGIGPCSCSEAQPEALRLELHQECADFATSLRSAANVVQLRGKQAPPSFLRAADLFEQAASEIQQLKAQLSARQAAPDETLRDALVRARDWFESQAKVVSKGCGSPWNLMQLRDERDAADAALSATPPPPEREPLTKEQIDDLCGEANRGFYIEAGTIPQSVSGCGASTRNRSHQ